MAIITNPKTNREIHVKEFLIDSKDVSREEIRTAELTICERCGALFAPTPQVEKIGQTISDQYIIAVPAVR